MKIFKYDEFIFVSHSYRWQRRSLKNWSRLLFFPLIRCCWNKSISFSKLFQIIHDFGDQFGRQIQVDKIFSELSYLRKNTIETFKFERENVYTHRSQIYMLFSSRIKSESALEKSSRSNFHSSEKECCVIPSELSIRCLLFWTVWHMAPWPPTGWGAHLAILPQQRGTKRPCTQCTLNGSLPADAHNGSSHPTDSLSAEYFVTLRSLPPSMETKWMYQREMRSSVCTLLVRSIASPRRIWWSCRELENI